MATSGVPQIDYSWIGNLQKNYEQGAQWGRESQLRNVLGSQTAQDLLKKQDFAGLAALVSRIDPEYGRKILAEASTASAKYGLNPVQVWNPQTRQYEMWQPYSGGGPPQKMEFGGSLPTAQQRWLEGPEGAYRVPAKGPYSIPQEGVGPEGGQSRVDEGMAAPQYAPQPIGPEGQPMAPQEGPGAVPQTAPPVAQGDQQLYNTPQPGQPGQGYPTLGSTKQNRDFRIAQTNDINTIRIMDEQIRLLESNMNELLTPEGQAAPGLRAISGTYKPGLGIEIPKDWVPTTREASANTTGALQTFAVEIGLKALSDMRAQSAQGASGMGQLAIQESIWLQQSVKNLQTAQSPEKIAENAKLVLYHARRVRDILHQGYQQIYGGQQMPTEVPPPEAGGGPPPPGAPQGQRKRYDMNGNPL